MSERPGKTSSGSSGSSKKKASQSAAQGAPLPPDGSPISAYPDKCCVLVHLDHDSEPAWYMLLFRIGKRGPPFCGRMFHPPTSPSWNSRTGAARSIPDPTIVLGSTWPLRGRSAESAGGEEDPLMTGELVEGSLMIDHLFSVRQGSDAGEPSVQRSEETYSP